MAGHDRLTPEGLRFFRELEQLRRLECRVGYQQDGTKAMERDKDGEIQETDIDLLDVAMWNEQGNARIPERPFLRNSVDGNRQKIEDFCREATQLLVKGASAQQILNMVGSKQKALVQKSITDGTFTPNASETVQRKRSDHPLIDTEQLRQSVNYIIRKKGAF